MRLDELGGRPVLAVASLADPRPFFQVLRGAGAAVEEASSSDHHVFSTRDAASIVERASGRMIVMTRKEAVKLRHLLDPGTPAFFLDQTVTIEAGLDEMDEAVNRVLGG
jgi:tetraacyldisaccharide-1-P 4'-kinase